MLEGSLTRSMRMYTSCARSGALALVRMRRLKKFCRPERCSAYRRSTSDGLGSVTAAYQNFSPLYKSPEDPKSTTSSEEPPTVLRHAAAFRARRL